MQEKSIFDLKSSGILETEAIVGKVVKKSELLTSKIKTFYFFLGVADETASVKLMVYGKDHHRRIKEGSSYIFKELKIDGKDVKVVKVNASSKVSETKPVFVPEEFEREAERLVYPESPLTSIKDIKSSPPQTYVSVEGTVSKVSSNCRPTSWSLVRLVMHSTNVSFTFLNAFSRSYEPIY